MIALVKSSVSMYSRPIHLCALEIKTKDGNDCYENIHVHVPVVLTIQTEIPLQIPT